MSDRTWPKLMSAAMSAVDHAFAVAIEAQTRRERAKSDARPLADRIGELVEVARLYGGDEPALVSDAERFFPPPPRTNLAIGARPVPGGGWEVAWPSAVEPHLGAVAERWLARVENRTARARLYLATPPDTVTARPAMIAVHGYMGGQWLLEERHWPIGELVRRGLDVALPILPLHGGRASAHRGAPGFPSSDRRLTNEGFRQAIGDIRTLAAWLRERGAPHVGVMGMSLGGYIAALLATLTDTVDFVVPMIPLASLADFAREQGRLDPGQAGEEEHAAIERAHWVTSPLARPLKLPPRRALVIAAEHDRITPIGHARRIAAHFGAETMTLRGGHLLQLGRQAAFRGLVTMLEREQILTSRTRY
jgi:pimeloyl-ACP methyl ester carboxylesterase